MKTYPKMKDSGVEWIGKIPEHWNIKKLKQIVKQNGNSIKPGPFGSDLTNNHFMEKGYQIYDQKYVLEQGKITNFVSKEKFLQMKTFEVCSGDILVTSRGTIGKSRLVQKNEKNGIIHSSVIRIRVDNSIMHKNYLNKIIDDSDFFRTNIKLNSNSTVIDVIYGYTIKEIKIPIPPIKEQRQILEFLDVKITKMDLEIEKNLKLSELLKTKRQSMINQAVTKGLDLSVPMKDSGIERIGEIPEHWNVRKFKTIGKLNSGGTPSTQVKEYWNNGTIPWLSSGEINNNIIESSNEKITELGLRESTARLFPKGSVLLAITGQGKTRGRTSLLKIDSSSNQSVVGIAIDHSKIFNYFLWYYLQSQYWNLRSLSQGSVQSGLNLHILKNYYIPSNSLIEQKEIVDYIDEHTLKINLVIKNIQSQIKKLQEFTQSLTSSAVTGKIDVRGIII